MSAIYLTGTDGHERVYSFREILEVHDREADVLKAIDTLVDAMDDMGDYQGDIEQIVGALPGYWDRTHAEPVISKLEDTARLMATSTEYLNDAVRNLRLLVKAGREARTVELQYWNDYNFREDHYRASAMKQMKWQLHLHFYV